MKWRSTFCLFVIAHLADGQNLIPNPGFEEVFSEIEYQWVQPQGPYYHYEKTDSLSLHEAHSGDYVNGLCMYNNRENEFLHIKLIDPLQEGVTYQLSVRARLMKAKCFNDHLQELIGVHFGKERLDTHIPGDLYLEPQLNLELPDSNRFEWFELSDAYTAAGGEEYLTIGYFAATQTEEMRRAEIIEQVPQVEDKSNESDADNSWLYLPPAEQKKYIKDQKKKAKKRKKNKEKSEKILDFSKPESDWQHLPESGKDPSSLYFMVRYYFDDFCLSAKPENGDADCDPSTPPLILERGKKIALRNVFFETDEAKLLNESIVQLSALNKILNEYPKMNIELHGHTDDRGDDDYNMSLSKDRAAAVMRWLIDQGVPQDRLSYKGFGEQNPIESNATEAGRTRNRRVEFLIVDM